MITELPYKPVQITHDNVLTEDGSIYRIDDDGEFEAIYIHKAKSAVKTPKKAKPVIKEYTEEFEYMWSMWTEKIKNGSNKQSSFIAFNNCSQKSKDALCYSIDPYAKTNEAKYLKRCETYINQNHWESVGEFEATAKDIVPPPADTIWQSRIPNDIGITDTARNQVERFGMSREDAWSRIQGLSK